MKLQPNALRFHNWQGEVTRSLLWVVGCFVSLYSSYENCVNILNRKMSFMIGFLNPFSYDPLKAEANFLFPFVGWSWFLFFLWQNITFPFSLLLGGDGFCFSFGKTSHFFNLFAMLGTENWTQAFCFQIEEVFDQVSPSLPPSLPPSPKAHENQECF